MRRKTRLLTAILTLLLGLTGVDTLLGIDADAANVSSLVISQLKITSSNGQWLMLYNTGDTTLDMSKFQLVYFNSYDLTKATSSKLVALTGTVPPHSSFLVSDSAQQLCYQLTVDSVSLGFSSTAGFVEVTGVNQAIVGGPVLTTLQDYVGWSKTAAAGAQTLPANQAALLLRQPLDGQHNPAVPTAGAGSWLAVQPDANNSCNLVSTANPATTVMTGGQLLPSAPPTTVIMSAAPAAGQTTAVPAADDGLMAPVITELLPNPTGTGNDASEEFIELYNPNPVSFDLSGFRLQAGTTALHSFTFAAGTSLTPQSYVAYYSSYTGLSLSNSGGQVKLLQPDGTPISSSDVYGTAKDGQSWALANGAWLWTTKLTPGLANVITAPIAKSSAKQSSGSSTKRTASSKSATALAASPAAAVSDTTPIHPWVLALVAGAALLYGAYEYRTDLANRFQKLRRHRRTRRRRRLETARR